MTYCIPDVTRLQEGLVPLTDHQMLLNPRNHIILTKTILSSMHTGRMPAPKTTPIISSHHPSRYDRSLPHSRGQTRPASL